jgi:hypothetical protein
MTTMTATAAMATMTTTRDRYLTSHERFEDVLMSVPPERWDDPTPRSEWTVRDVAGHVIWGQDLIRAWATGAAFDNAVGAPGAPSPGDYASADPVARWQEARESSVAALTPEGLARVIPSRAWDPADASR